MKFIKKDDEDFSSRVPEYGDLDFDPKIEAQIDLRLTNPHLSENQIMAIAKLMNEE